MNGTFGWYSSEGRRELEMRWGVRPCGCDHRHDHEWDPRGHHPSGCGHHQHCGCRPEPCRHWEPPRSCHDRRCGCRHDHDHDHGRFHLPCAVTLRGARFADGFEPAGSALARRDNPGRELISVLGVDLPEPEVFGRFNAYAAFAAVPGDGEVDWALFRTREPGSATWAGTGELGRRGLTPALRLEVRPVNFSTGHSGPAVLSGSLERCGR